MKVTGTDLHRSPGKVFRRAYDNKEKPIVINHGQYPDQVFELTCRDRKKQITQGDKSGK